MIALDVSSLNTIQNVFLDHLTAGFGLLTIYAKRLLYYFIAFEIVLSGLGWALYQNQYAERLFFQILKIGLILFVVENYTYLLNTLLGSMTIISDKLMNTHVESLLLNPGAIWQYGYNFSLSLLQTAASAEGFAIPMIFTILGFGILLVIGIFGIQIFLTVIGFYLVALVSLLSIPLSVFSPLKDFFSQSMKSILQASIRLMVQMLIVSVALTVWSEMKLLNFDNSMTISVPLGLLFTGLLFVFASAYLPKLACKVIGNIQTQTPIAGTTASSQTTQIIQQPTPTHITQNTAPIGLPTAANLHITSQTLQSMQVHTHTTLQTQDRRDNLRTLINAAEFSIEKDQHVAKEKDEEINKIKQAFYEVLEEMKKSTDKPTNNG